MPPKASPSAYAAAWKRAGDQRRSRIAVGAIIYIFWYSDEAVPIAKDAAAE
jgi:hypothetical protein